MTDQALAVSGAIYSFAKKSGDYLLMKSVDFQKTDFDRFRDAVLVIELNSIKDKAVQYSAEIARYGITAEKFAEFENKVNEYVNALSAKNTGSATKQGANKTMVSLFKEADSLVDSIDRFMESYKITDKDFYDGYKAARSIKDLGIRHNGGNGSNGTNGLNGSAGVPDNTGQNNPQTAGLITSGDSTGNLNGNNS